MGPYKISVWYFVFAVLGVVLARDLWTQHQRVEVVPYSVFETLLANGRVSEVVVGKEEVIGTLRQPRKDERPQVAAVRVDDPGFIERLRIAGVSFSGQHDSGLLSTVMSWVLPTLGFVLVWMYLVKPALSRQAGGLMTIGKSRAKIYVEKDTKVTFADVAGVDEEKEELREVVGFLKEPKRFGRLGARLPKGVLLVGPPGTGKTLLARAVAGEAGVPFFSISGSEFVEMFVGVGAARVRDLFEQARTHAPCIIFIDELDALGRARGTFTLGGHDEKEQTLNQLLAELDGFDPASGVVLLAATNRPEILDPALLRAGRFDRQVLVDRPDKKGRADILKVHLRKVTLAAGLDVEAIAALTPGFTGADLANLVNEAAILATRRGGETTTLEDFTQAIERIVAGLEKRNRLLNPYERKVIAHHEMGHAIVAMALPGSDPVHKVSIIPRGVGALGYTIQRPTEDRFLMSRSELENRITVLLGGRAAEAVAFPDMSTGGADDLAKATLLARSMVTRFGMAADLGQVSYEADPGPYLGAQGPHWEPRAYGEATASAIDRAVQEIIRCMFEKAKAIMERNRQVLGKGAQDLLDRETLGADDLRHLAELLAQAEPNGPAEPLKASAIVDA